MLVAKLDFIACIFSISIIGVMVIDGRWGTLQILWTTIICFTGALWLIKILLSWPKPASIITWNDSIMNIGWLGFMAFITLGLIASIVVPRRDGYSDAYLIFGASGARTANLRIGVPECIHGIRMIRLRLAS